MSLLQFCQELETLRCEKIYNGLGELFGLLCERFFKSVCVCSVFENTFNQNKLGTDFCTDLSENCMKTCSSPLKFSFRWHNTARHQRFVTCQPGTVSYCLGQQKFGEKKRENWKITNSEISKFVNLRFFLSYHICLDVREMHSYVRRQVKNRCSVR